MFIKILDFKIFSGTKEEFISYIKKLEKVNIISGNPEILYRGSADEFLRKIYLDAQSVIIPDGVGTVLASKILKTEVKEKIAGIEIMEEIIKVSEKEGKGIYLVGAKEDVLKECNINLMLKYPKLKVLGSKNGYFDLEDCQELIRDIKEKKPYAIFIAMGCPRQELFIQKYIDELPCKIFMGVGGSFDVFAGKVSRAPKWMLDMGLEWLYRVFKEPFRIKRLLYIPKFLLKVIIRKHSRTNRMQ